MGTGSRSERDKHLELLIPDSGQGVLRDEGYERIRNATDGGRCALGRELFAHNFPPDCADWAVLCHTGMALHDLCRFREAREALLRARRISTGDLRALACLNLGRTCRKLWMLEEAERWLSEALRLESGKALVHLDMGRLHRQASRTEEAEVELRAAGETDDCDVAFNAYFALGLLYRAERRYPEALSSLTEALSFRPGNDEVRQAAEDVRQVVTDLPAMKPSATVDELLDAFREAHREDYPALAAELGETCVLERPEAIWHRLYARSLLDADRFHEAQVHARRAVEISEPKREGISLRLIGLVAEEVGDLAEAERAYREALAVQPENCNTHSFLGTLLHERERLEEAEAVLCAGTRCPDGAVDEVWFKLGLVLRTARRYREALECFEEALAIDPDYEAARTPREDVESVLREFPELEHAGALRMDIIDNATGVDP